MFRWFSRRRHLERTAHNIYGSIVAASRHPELFAVYGVPDTAEGRLELLSAHMFVVLERLAGEDGEWRGVAQSLVDTFFADMEVSARELGVGDMAVPKKMRQLAALVRLRWDNYGQAVRADDSRRLASLVGDAFAAAGEGPLAGEALARYLRSMLDELKQKPLAALEDAIAAASAKALRMTRPAGR